MSAMSAFHGFSLLEKGLKQVHQLLIDQEFILKELWSPLCEGLESSEDYQALGEIALKSLKTLDLERFPLMDFFLLVQKVGEREKSPIVVGRRFASPRINETVGGLFLLSGISFFLAGNFTSALQSLSKVNDYLQKDQSQSRLFTALSYLFLKEEKKAAYFLNLAVGESPENLLCLLVSYYLRKDFAKIKSRIEEHGGSHLVSLLRILSSNPLILYFYATAIHELNPSDLIHLRGISLSRFERILTPALEARFCSEQKYFFIDDLLKQLYAGLSEQMAVKARAKAKATAWQEVLTALEKVEALGGTGEEVPAEVMGHLERLRIIRVSGINPGISHGISWPESFPLGAGAGAGSSNEGRKQALCFGSTLPLLKRVMSTALVSGDDGETGGSPFAFSTDSGSPELDGLNVRPDSGMG